MAIFRQQRISSELVIPMDYHRFHVPATAISYNFVDASTAIYFDAISEGPLNRVD